MTDLEVLTLAAQQQRVLVSHHLGTMPAHFRALRSAGGHSAGVLLVPERLDIAIAIEKMLLIWTASEASEWENRLEWLPL